MAATKADILRLENRIEANKHEILKWLIGLLVAQGAFVIGVLAYIK
jgi:hypothetical protein